MTGTEESFDWNLYGGKRKGQITVHSIVAKEAG